MTVIDLTQDSDSEDQRVLSHGSSSLSLGSSSNPTKTSLSTTVTTNKTSSDTDASFSDHVFKPRADNPSTPSPSPSHLEAPSVVIPSPSRQLRRQIANSDWVKDAPNSELELTGLSSQYYPVDAHEKRALKGAYPRTRKVNRAEVPLSIGTPGPVPLTDRTAVQQQLLATLHRKLSKIKGPPVTLAPGEERRLADFASNFEFVNAYILRKGVSRISSEFIGGCHCQVCDPARCACLRQDAESTDKMIPYQRAPGNPRLLVLSQEFLMTMEMILECTSNCTCDQSQCWNRVVQHGRTIPLQIFYTGNRGFGLRSSEKIHAGQFIDCYLGEVITTDEADVREEVATSKHGHSYLFELDFYKNDEEVYVVDGQKFGSATRFMNHSCNPNCKIFPVSQSQDADTRLYDLAFFALRDIPPMTELTFDYNPNWGEGRNVDPSAVRCLCGEPNCRGQLWPNQRKGTK
ncbi:histone-lysine N-methyltransferase Clr4 [Aspergillus clavatus NRRL 1]|uniref:Histone-lysine n-methyltransferase, suv9 n=1 Tax=Aspergillus clavatus (strain ATCC 1007 / CBS 513.65 / DSM 816 / NCTC 3887 / NRRL 1 / QM 1276 / 107) TaxID=344612 RepID=A1CQ10_ASPCL|nr:histone-lysine n-methyltransferase, suv9 [Aspergillus clavatus NRRL 1]EAW07731.1 histone-lysine n-methyltransferase, suv9 [Aspergillus clavatus NRRL 1]